MMAPRSASDALQMATVELALADTQRPQHAVFSDEAVEGRDTDANVAGRFLAAETVGRITVEILTTRHLRNRLDEILKCVA